MRSLKLVALLAFVLLPAATIAQAEVHIQVGVGVPVYGGGYAYGPPACPYGYYAEPPYACAPYGYYGPQWFADGVFIGAGPWYGGAYGGYRRDWDGDRGYGYGDGWRHEDDHRGWGGWGDRGWGHHDDDNRGWYSRGNDFHSEHGGWGRH
ncbi:MAG: hypothetical protein KGK08_07970 [Acidobacteriota bacterium]|nr:hypothetical protein [Acidobacteriota bacterium]